MRNKGQVVLEAVLIFILVLLGFLTMRGYFKRAFQSYCKSNVDSFSDEQYSRTDSVEQGSAGSDPGSLVFSDTTITTDLSGSTNILSGGGNVKAIPRGATGGGSGTW